MAIRPRGGGTATPAVTKPAVVAAPRTRAAPADATAQAADATATATAATTATTAPTTGIVPPRVRAAAARAATSAAAVATGGAPVEAPGDDMESWGHTGTEAEAMANQQVVQRERAREERRARGYWPRKFELIEPQARYPDRWQAEVIVLDVKMSPSFWLHVLQNARTGRYDVNEPCPKEWDNCPLCPPAGKYDSRFVFLLTVLNINGYTRQTGPNAGEFVPITHEIMVVDTDNAAFFHNLLRERGEAGLRGLQLTMTRADKNAPRIGVPSIPGGAEQHIFHDDAAIEKFIRDNGMWKPKMTREGEKIAEDDWLMHPYRYSEFLHKPSAADLRTRYMGGAGAPVGARDSSGGGEWGGSRYEPGAASAPSQTAQWGDQVASAADLDDDVPF